MPVVAGSGSSRSTGDGADLLEIRSILHTIPRRGYDSIDIIIISCIIIIMIIAASFVSRICVTQTQTRSLLASLLHLTDYCLLSALSFPLLRAHRALPQTSPHTFRPTFIVIASVTLFLTRPPLSHQSSDDGSQDERQCLRIICQIRAASECASATRCFVSSSVSKPVWRRQSLPSCASRPFRVSSPCLHPTIAGR